MRESDMNRKRPSGRDCALAQSALATVQERERREQELAASSARAPAFAILRNAQKGAIRLIDLERRAQFARLAS